EADHRRRHGAGGVRQRRPRHLHHLARLPEAVRADGVLRQRLRPCGHPRPRRAGGQGLALRDAADAQHLHGEARGPGGDGGGVVRGGEERRGEDHGQPDLRAEGRGGGAPGAGGAEDDGEHGAVAGV
ncbi:MAG: Quinone oxidoreductase, partial [uncultured Chloroflexia bacterium]